MKVTLSKEKRKWTVTQGRLEFVSCNFCGSNEDTLVCVENQMQIVQCKRCKLIYVNPMPTMDELQLFYQQYYPQDSALCWQMENEPLFEEDSKRILRCRSIGTLLEVGCGHGFFLNKMKLNGWDVVGIDLSKDAVDYGRRNFGLDLKVGDLLDVDFPKESFDVVVSWFVLEHVRRPGELIKKVQTLLKPKGLFYFRVPNHNFMNLYNYFKLFQNSKLFSSILSKIRYGTDRVSIYRFLDPPAHLHSMSPKVIQRFLKNNNWRNVYVYNGEMYRRGTILNRIIDLCVKIICDTIYYITFRRFVLYPVLYVIAQKDDR